MNFFKGTVIFIYLIIYVIVGGGLLVISLDILPYDSMAGFVRDFINVPNMKIAIGAVGVLFIFIGILSTKFNFGKLQQEKTIAFENPDGQVVVSLMAIEDYIKRMVKNLPQVKELRSSVSATKKGIFVEAKATLFSDSNIPDVTEKIQAIIKNKLLEMLGIEESINVKIHVSKLINRQGKEDFDEIKEERRHMPFRGMIW